MSGAGAFDDRFDAGHLDPAVWTAGYLPAWSSLAESAAAYRIAADGLHLTIPPEHPLWCPDLHDGPLRVSAVQTGNWSGPVGSTQGQQPFRDGLVVREEQPARGGFTPKFGTVEVVCRATIGARSMFSAWLVGLEDDPRRCGEICIVEVFGDSVQVDALGAVTAALGTGIHRFRDPLLREEFSADRVAIDVGTPHAFSVQWRPGSVTFLLDGKPVKQLSQAPDYPMQLILGVFDFPDRVATSGGSDPAIPELVVSSVRGRPLPPE